MPLSMPTISSCSMPTMPNNSMMSGSMSTMPTLMADDLELSADDARPADDVRLKSTMPMLMPTMSAMFRDAFWMFSASNTQTCLGAVAETGRSIWITLAVKT